MSVVIETPAGTLTIAREGDECVVALAAKGRSNDLLIDIRRPLSECCLQLPEDLGGAPAELHVGNTCLMLRPADLARACAELGISG